MSKFDVTVSRSLTISTGNYESIKPTVNITAKDIDAEDIGDVYQALDDVVTGLMKFEIVNCTSEVRLVDGDLNGYCRRTTANAEGIGNDLDKSLDKLATF